MRLMLLLACLLAYASSAHAQHLPAALMVRPSLALDAQPRDPELRLAPLDRDLHRVE